MKDRNRITATILLAFAWLGIAPVTPAKQQSEDRGNGNSAAEDVDALNVNTTGSNNTAHGWFSLFDNSTGSSNTADGFQALYSNSTGGGNTANGAFALFSNTNGGGNTASGFHALFSNINGNANTASGNHALLSNTSGNGNTATGAFSLESNTEGSRNTATGVEALDLNTTGSDNAAMGFFALRRNTTGDNNTANGVEALVNNNIGSANTATGSLALFSNTEGDENTAHGVGALVFNSVGSQNTAIGSNALANNRSGDRNIALGHSAGLGITSGRNIIAIGDVLGTSTVAGEVNDSCYIGNVFNTPVDFGTAQTVLVDQDGKLGTAGFSSQRFKKEIRPMGQTSEAVLALKPVTFQYKYDKRGAPQFGLIAEDVAQMNADLVVRDRNGQPLAVRYDAVTAMLLNEFLKERKKVEEQQASIGILRDTVARQEATLVQQQKDFRSAISAQQKEIEVLTACLKEQAAHIQKVSAHAQMTGPAVKTVLNNK